MGPTQPEAQWRLGLALPSPQRKPWSAALDIAGLTLAHVHIHDLDTRFPHPAVARTINHFFFSPAASELRCRWPRHLEKGHGGHEPGHFDADADVPAETPTAAFPYADTTPPTSRTALA